MKDLSTPKSRHEKGVQKRKFNQPIDQSINHQTNRTFAWVFNHMCLIQLDARTRQASWQFICSELRLSPSPQQTRELSPSSLSNTPSPPLPPPSQTCQFLIPPLPSPPPLLNTPTKNAGLDRSNACLSRRTAFGAVFLCTKRFERGCSCSNDRF